MGASRSHVYWCRSGDGKSASSASKAGGGSGPESLAQVTHLTLTSVYSAIPRSVSAARIDGTSTDSARDVTGMLAPLDQQPARSPAAARGSGERPLDAGTQVVCMRIAMDAMSTEGPAGGDPANSADDARRRWATQVGSALHGIDGIGASALRLIYSQHLTQAEVARRLGVAESTVKTQVARALGQLAKRLAASDPHTA